MPRKKLTEEEKVERNKERVRNKILNNEPLTITDLAKLLNKKSCTIKKWEWDEMIPKPNLVNGVRMYNIKDLSKVLHGIYNYPWQRKVVDLAEIKQLMDYVDSVVNVNSIKKRDICASPYEFKGELY